MGGFPLDLLRGVTHGPRADDELVPEVGHCLGCDLSQPMNVPLRRGRASKNEGIEMKLSVKFLCPAEFRKRIGMKLAQKVKSGR